ncbi:MAG: hypothetical protein MRJ67_17605 [Nitrospirales bacterium]|nr:hypothetical protein [Nitrospirales bacterium]MDR4484597.1 hypothetical protein [Nitrospirales bacterium]
MRQQWRGWAGSPIEVWQPIRSCPITAAQRAQAPSLPNPFTRRYMFRKGYLGVEIFAPPGQVTASSIPIDGQRK